MECSYRDPLRNELARHGRARNAVSYTHLDVYKRQVKVPLTLIISQALFVRCGSAVFALPLAVIEEIRRLKPAEIEDVGGRLLTRVRDVVTEVVRLDLQLALPPLEPVNGYFHMVIVKVAGKQVGVVVEEVLGKDEIVIKNLGNYLRRVKLFPGTTIAPDGSCLLYTSRCV